ncbi:alpha/beta hydrolase [Gordonia sp. CPCC 206044]|uniref:alpha/beta fold hydrolase n=1 Tax=Gordonia sp. CPCC 206044 TaxID=3140793 RepID=UPI003AF3E673
MPSTVERAVTRWTSRAGISVEIRGTGDPVLLMHGIGGSARTCVRLAEILADNGYQSLCWDAPGYGRSADPVGRVELDAAVDELLDELGLPSAHLFGTSWGGVIATAVALRFPHRVRSITLADSTRGSATSPQKADGMRERVVELRTLGADAFADRRAPRLVSQRCDPAIATAVRTDMARVRTPGYTVAADHMASTDHGPRLHLIARPTLIVVGADDVVTGVDESRLLADAIPGARLGLVVDAGHAAVQERPDAVAAHVLPFLREVVR